MSWILPSLFQSSIIASSQPPLVTSSPWELIRVLLGHGAIEGEYSTQCVCTVRRWLPTYNGWVFRPLTLQWSKSDLYSVETGLWILIFFWTNNLLSSLDDDSDPSSQSSVWSAEGDHWYCKVQCLTNYMAYSALYHTRGYVLGDFAQLYANVNMLSMLFFFRCFETGSLLWSPKILLPQSPECQMYREHI
jgi:hypothetical protein